MTKWLSVNEMLAQFYAVNTVLAPCMHSPGDTEGVPGATVLINLVSIVRLSMLLFHILIRSMKILCEIFYR